MAQVGLCDLPTEEQLKEALASKDRLFLLVVSKEIEAFINRIIAGETPDAMNQVAFGSTGSSALASLGSSAKIQAVASSKFQRMLVYKADEWYGLKAVAGPENSLVVGVLGTLHEKRWVIPVRMLLTFSTSLRLHELVVAPATTEKSFKIMQRANGSAMTSQASSVSGEDGSSAFKVKTLEEREADYLLARERILGTSQDPESETQVESNSAGESYGRAALTRHEEIDPVPRYIDPVYPSLHHPPIPQVQMPPSLPPDASYHQHDDGSYTSYEHITSMPAMPHYQNGLPSSGYPSQHPDQYYPMQQPYIDGGYPTPRFGYPTQQWQQPPSNYPVYAGPPSQQMMQPPPQTAQGQWYPGQMPPMNQGQPLQMIPQGLPAFQQPYYPQQPMYQPNLIQPMPVRPQPYPHSSASSSMSSRSYHDQSRPHSRGSTTSTRSAASSVRLGVMYPAQSGSGPGYRQQGMNGHGLSGMTSMGYNGRRNNRAHSPVRPAISVIDRANNLQSSVASAVSSSSRSSRWTKISVIPIQDGQHQLPTRPDWSAKNIPYHPSPIPPYSSQMPNGPNVSDFPPLRNGTLAQPMQMERAKMRPNANIWNGVASKTLQNGQNIGPRPQTPVTDPSTAPRSPAPLPIQAPQIQAPFIQNNSNGTTETDPDFPRRVPSSRAQPPLTLYEPSSRAPSDGRTSCIPPATEMSAADVIEARLAAISLNTGISIGPPPARNGRAMQGFCGGSESLEWS